MAPCRTGEPRGVSAPKNVAEHVLDRLAQWGVHRFYGYPGDGIGGFFTALPER